MSTWSAEAAQRDDRRLELARLQAEKSLQDYRILQTKGNVLWAQLRSFVGKRCNEFNAEPGKMGTLNCDANSLKCKIWLTGHDACVIGSFSDATFQFTGQSPVDFEAYWQVRLASNGLDVWVADSKRSPVTLTEIADAVIEVLLGYR